MDNEAFRRAWLKRTLAALPAGSSILDVGAGECQFKPFCAHLDYTAQDIAQYDGKGDGRGLQTGAWSFAQIDLVCDLLDIPEDRPWHTVLCTEVLEHVPDPAAALAKLARLVAPGGQVIVTAPFNSLTHFAPYHYATGLSRHFYEWHLSRAGLVVEEMTPNGGWFDAMAQELGRTGQVRGRYSRWPLDPVSFLLAQTARLAMLGLAALDGPREARRSSELQTFGWHVRARRPA